MAFADAQSGTIIFHGESPAPIKLSGTVSKGDPVGWATIGGGWQRADASTDADTSEPIHAKCVASEDGVTDQIITAYFGEVSLGGRISGATVGGAIYASETAGQYTQTIPTDTGDASEVIGYATAPDRITVFCCMNQESEVA